jgi:hypothetical protein
VRAARQCVGIMRAVIWTAAALLLGACATPDHPETGKWKFEPVFDPTVDAPVTTAFLSISRFELLTGDLYEGNLQLMCFRKRPIIRFAFNIKVGTDRSAGVTYRFDGHPAREVNAKFFARDKVIVIDRLDEVEQFVGQLASAQNLFLRITVLTTDSIVARFEVHGARHAIERSFATCPLPDKAGSSKHAQPAHRDLRKTVDDIRRDSNPPRYVTA